MFRLTRPAGADPSEVESRPIQLRDYLIWMALNIGTHDAAPLHRGGG